MTEMFWTVATSTTALSIVAVIMVAAGVVAHFPFIKRIPVLAPYVVFAGFISYLALADLALCIGYRIADEHAETMRLQGDLARSNRQLAEQKATAKDAERIANEKAAEANELKGKVADYEKALEAAAAANPQSACALSDDDVARLRALSVRRPRKH
ncbi:hypothetical protein [Bradyrhizobium elkanii]|uniref:Uncharacterized protein n=1 Tax=Bradyrhizobium elkanii TaxID=29448 RepID=A0A8I1YC13_BRAEL|nr:hypothetical protein [Bradyrhizobium elkanii]MBP1296607.1 hypothetical protein [Bradyrhizobium elkanii]